MANPDLVPHTDTDQLTRHERLEITGELLSRLADPDEDREVLEDRIIETNLVVARQVARRYQGRGVALDDLEQVACLGLVKAVRSYDPDKATDFLSFAVPTIRGEVRRWFRDAGWTVRPPRSVQELQAAISVAQEELQQCRGHAPRPAELAEHLGVDEERVHDAISARGCFSPVSLDAPPVGPEGAQNYGERLAQTEPGYGSAEARAALEPELRKLSRRERTILAMRFGEGATQREIGEEIGVTQMQVSRLLSGIFARLREQLSGNTHDDGAQVA